MKIPEQKVILCGEFGVGKSSLFRRFMSDTFTTATDRSIENFFFLTNFIVQILNFKRPVLPEFSILALV